MSTQQQWQVISPEGDTENSAFSNAARGGDFSGKKVGLFWNGKPGGNVFLEEVGEQLASRFPGVKLERFWETRPDTMTSYGNSKANLAFMAEQADLVIAASSD